jgi:hypothetical protein
MCLQRYKDSFFVISIGDITARKKCKRYDKDKYDEMTLGRLSLKAWEKQSETILERRRVK